MSKCNIAAGGTLSDVVWLSSNGAADWSLKWQLQGFISNRIWASCQLHRVISGQTWRVRWSWLVQCFAVYASGIWMALNLGHCFLAAGRQGEGEDGGWSGGSVWHQHWQKWGQQQAHKRLGWHSADCRLNSVEQEFAMLAQQIWDFKCWWLAFVSTCCREEYTWNSQWNS